MSLQRGNMENVIYKSYPHNPPHLFRQNAKYFITGATYLKRRFLSQPECKLHLLHSITKGCKKYDWTLEDWVILDNHYHLMLQSPGSPETMSLLFNEIHKFTAIWLKKNISILKNKGKIFHNYWDTCITYEKSYFARLNYIYFNPVKHGYVEIAEDYIFGSYHYRIKIEKGYLEEIKGKYPWDRVNVKDNF